MDHTLNLNSAECIRTAAHWGLTRTHNICSGAVSDVPWGALDYAGAILIGGFAAFAVAIMLAMVVMMFIVIFD